VRLVLAKSSANTLSRKRANFLPPGSSSRATRQCRDTEVRLHPGRLFSQPSNEGLSKTKPKCASEPAELDTSALAPAAVFRVPDLFSHSAVKSKKDRGECRLFGPRERLHNCQIMFTACVRGGRYMVPDRFLTFPLIAPPVTIRGAGIFRTGRNGRG